jgi:hypothetical protein
MTHFQRRNLLTAFVLLLALGAVSAVYAQAEPLSYGAFTSATIDTANPGRFYEFTGAAGDFIGLEALSIDNALDPRISLLDSTGQQTLAVSTDDPFQVGSQDARLTYTLPVDGTFTLLVEGEDATTGQFLLRLALLTSPEPEPLSQGVVTPVTLSPDIPSRAFAVDSSLANTVTVSSTVAGVAYIAELRSPTGQTLAVQRGPLATAFAATVDGDSGTYLLVLSVGQANQSAALEVNFGGAATDLGESSVEAAPLPDDPAATEEAVVEGTDGTGDTTVIIPGNVASATLDPSVLDIAPGGNDDGPAPVPTSDTLAANAPENRCTVVPVGDAGVNIRQEPSTSSPVIASIPAGEFRFGDATNGAWIRLVGGGWVSTGVVEASAACVNLSAVNAGAGAVDAPAPAAPQPTPEPGVAPIGERN